MKRNQGIDLLRIVSMYMVCVLHTLGQGGVLETLSVGSTKYYAFWLLEISQYYAVNSFALISGYTLTEDKP
ncbi:MAG: hypothetical protein IKR46_01015 [Clostridia bacterium]|nr:hypothetical protein [Clostridia bacterium]